jgi:hypothetical protein
MGMTVVQYQTKPERADENQRLVEAVYAELAASNPNHLRYLTVRLDDGVTFVHVAAHDGDGPNPLVTTAAFAEFQREIGDRCVVQPEARQGALVGSFGFGLPTPDGAEVS